MKLPHLDQLVPLERGEAGLLAGALAVLVQDATRRPPMTGPQALKLAPLASLGRRLVQRHQQEQLRPLRRGQRPAARPVRVRFDELVALLDSRAALYYTGLTATEQLQLRVVLDRFHQKSLNLEQFIRF